jgi:hypothetical protein
MRVIDQRQNLVGRCGRRPEFFHDRARGEVGKRDRLVDRRAGRESERQGCTFLR